MMVQGYSPGYMGWMSTLVVSGVCVQGWDQAGLMVQTGSARMSNRMDAKVETSTVSDPCGGGPKPAQRALYRYPCRIQRLRRVVFGCGSGVNQKLVQSTC